MLLDSRTRPVHQILEGYLPPDVLAYALRLWSTEYVQQQNISMLSFVDAFYHRQSLPYSRQHIYSSLLPALMEVLTVRSTFDESTTDLYEFPDYDLPGGMATAQGGGESPMIAPAAPAVPPPPSVSAFAPAPEAVVPPMPQQELRQVVQATPAVPTTPAPVLMAASEPVRDLRDQRFLAFSTFVRKLMKSLSQEKRKKMLFYYRKNLMQAVPQSISAEFYEWLQSNSDYFVHQELDTQSMANVVHSIYTGLCNYLGPLDADDVLMKSANYIDDNFDKEALDVRDLL